jgi:hypothetical protein
MLSARLSIDAGADSHGHLWALPRNLHDYTGVGHDTGHAAWGTFDHAAYLAEVERAIVRREINSWEDLAAASGLAPPMHPRWSNIFGGVCPAVRLLVETAAANYSEHAPSFVSVSAAERTRADVGFGTDGLALPPPRPPCSGTWCTIASNRTLACWLRWTCPRQGLGRCTAATLQCAQACCMHPQRGRVSFALTGRGPRHCSRTCCCIDGFKVWMPGA